MLRNKPKNNLLICLLKKILINQFEVCKESLVIFKGYGQGYDWCKFKQQCKKNKGKYRAAGKLCISKCHDSWSCKNK